MPYRLDSSTAVAVIGAGTMGAGIAQLAAQAGHSVRLLDAQPGAAAAAQGRIAEELSDAVRRERLSAADRDGVLERIEVVAQLHELSTCGLAIEAIVEHLESKQALLSGLETVLHEHAVIASNTSSISITALAQRLLHRGRLIGWHFFNPATHMRLVEVVAGADTDPALVAAMHELSSRWGKFAVEAPNTPGFLVNRVARPFYGEALRLLAEQVASVSVIDRLLREGGGFAMGPFELMDLIGVDVNLAVTESVFQATGYDSRYVPHWIQQELVRGGRLGRKSGRGFYDYETALEEETPVRTTAAVAPVRHAREALLLAPLLARLRAAGVPCERDERLGPESCAIDEALVMLSDGRSAAARAAELARPVLLLDLARDFASTPVLGVAMSPHSESARDKLAASLACADIELLPLGDAAGLVVLRTVCCLANEAADMLTWTPAKARDIDTAMRLGTSYPIGPLAWADALDPARVARVLGHLQQHYGEPRYRRAPRLSQLSFSGGRFHD